jgi:opacity protein-like surface antigen
MAALVIVATFSAPASALKLGRALSLGAGVTFPMQPDEFKDFWNAGVALSAGLMFEPTRRLTLGVEVGYYRHELDRTAFEDAIRDEFPAVSVSGRALWFVPVTVVAELDLVRYAVVKPFLRAGVGVYPRRAQALTASGPGAVQLLEQQNNLDETSAGALFGLGIETPVSPGIDLGIDATYNFAFTEGQTTEFLAVRLTLRF